MPVEINNRQIILTVPIQGEAVPEQYVIKKGERIDPGLFGIPYRDPGALPSVIAQLRAQSLGLDNGRRKFVDCVVDNLKAAVVSVQNSWEY